MTRLRRARALTLVEVILSMLVVSVLLTAALYAVGASRKAESIARDRASAAVLADDLLGFIMRLSYKSPTGSILGIEVDDLLGDKTSFDDVDDFNGWKEAPPQYADGKPMAEFEGWSREVIVQWVDPADPSSVKGTETGTKRVTILVKKGNALLMQRVALRADIAAANE